MLSPWKSIQIHALTPQLFNHWARERYQGCDIGRQTSPKAPRPMMVSGSKSAALRRCLCRRRKSRSCRWRAFNTFCFSSSVASACCNSLSARTRLHSHALVVNAVVTCIAKSIHTPPPLRIGRQENISKVRTDVPPLVLKAGYVCLQYLPLFNHHAALHTPHICMLPFHLNHWVCSSCQA